MERYVSRSDWYLTDTEHTLLPIPELVYVFIKSVFSMF